eukprot:2472850-Rhodomonas_salina.1
MLEKELLVSAPSAPMRYMPACPREDDERSARVVVVEQEKGGGRTRQKRALFAWRLTDEHIAAQLEETSTHHSSQHIHITHHSSSHADLTAPSRALHTEEARTHLRDRLPEEGSDGEHGGCVLATEVLAMARRAGAAHAEELREEEKVEEEEEEERRARGEKGQRGA